MIENPTIDMKVNYTAEFKSIEHEHRINLLNSILKLLVPVTIFLSIFNVIVESNFETLFYINSYVDALLGLSILLLSYSINKFGHYRLAVWTLIILNGIAISIHVWQSSPPHLEMAHYIILLILAKPLLTKTELLFTTVITIFAVGLAAITIETISLFAAWNIMTFIIILYFLLHIISNFRNSLEASRRSIVQLSEARLRMLLDQVPALVWVSSDNLQQVASVNGNLHDLLEDFPQYIRDIHDKQKILLAVGQHKLMFDHVWHDKYYHNVLQAELGSRGEIIGYSGITIDITARQQEEIVKLEMAKSQERHEAATMFLNSAAHDLRTPLSVLNTSVYLVRNCSEDDRIRHLDNLQLSIDRLSKMVDDMFYMVKLEMYLPEVQSISIKAILRDIISRYNDRNQNLNRQFETQLNCTDECTLHGDITHFDRAISNVLDNAFQYSSENDRIELTATRTDNAIEVIIINCDSTIPDDHLPNVFNHFFRGEDYRSLDNNNIGLGLTITKKIVNLFHGEVQIESHEDIGTITTIIFPNPTTH